MNKKSFITLIAILTIVAGGYGFVALAAPVSSTQQFIVTVPQSISITAPTTATLTHDLTSNPQTFAPQVWQVQGNSNNGLTVNFSVSSPFVNTINPNFMRDVQLALAIGSTTGPAAWTVPVPNSVTDYAKQNPTASVQAHSNGVGGGNMQLTVSFITGSTATLLNGNYTTTVTGTVTSN